MMVPEHVLTAFRDGGDDEPVAMGPAWDNGWKIGSVVYSLATDTTSWSGRVRDELKVPGVRVTRPVRSSDGRFIVGGWKANTFIEGELALRTDETVLVALRLAEALANVPAPEASRRDDVFAVAEHDAWALCDDKYGPIDAPIQVGHADVFFSTIYSGFAAPVVTDLIPFAAPRPKMMSAAQVIADALIVQAEIGVDFGLVDRFSHIPDLNALLLRAITYRKLIAQAHPRTNSLTRSNVEKVEAALLSGEAGII